MKSKRLIGALCLIPELYFASWIRVQQMGGWFLFQAAQPWYRSTCAKISKAHCSFSRKNPSSIATPTNSIVFYSNFFFSSTKLVSVLVVRVWSLFNFCSSNATVPVSSCEEAAMRGKCTSLKNTRQYFVPSFQVELSSSHDGVAREPTFLWMKQRKLLRRDHFIF